MATSDDDKSQNPDEESDAPDDPPIPGTIDGADTDLDGEVFGGSIDSSD